MTDYQKAALDYYQAAIASGLSREQAESNAYNGARRAGATPQEATAAIQAAVVAGARETTNER